MRYFALIIALMPSPALAHPHMFLDTSIEVMFNSAGAAYAVRITWAYDDLSSLQYIADRGLDMDGDGALTPDENRQLAGFDMKWDAGFAGDSYALQGGVNLGLSPPRDWTADYRGGRIITTHIRDLPRPVVVKGAQDLVIQAYDPGFYTAYSIISATIRYAACGGCAAQIFVPDRTAADQVLLNALAEYGADQDIEADFPAIGAAYAEEIRITCGG